MWAGAGPGASACDMGLCVCTRMSAGLWVTVSVWNRGGVGDSVVSVSLLWGLCACLSSTPLHQGRDCGTVLVWAGLVWSRKPGWRSSCVCSETRLRAVLNRPQAHLDA